MRAGDLHERKRRLELVAPPRAGLANYSRAGHCAAPSAPLAQSSAAHPYNTLGRHMLRVYVDFNTMAQDEEARVWIPTSVRPDLMDLMAPGRVVVLFDETLEVQAVVERVAADEWWARPDRRTYRALVEREPVDAADRTG